MYNKLIHVSSLCVCSLLIHAMNLLRRDQARDSGSSFASYAPIAKALDKISDLEKEQLRHNFDIAFFIAKEKISFRKYPQLCELEA